MTLEANVMWQGLERFTLHTFSQSEARRHKPLRWWIIDEYNSQQGGEHPRYEVMGAVGGYDSLKEAQLARCQIILDKIKHWKVVRDYGASSNVSGTRVGVQLYA